MPKCDFKKVAKQRMRRKIKKPKLKIILNIKVAENNYHNSQLPLHIYK